MYKENTILQKLYQIILQFFIYQFVVYLSSMKGVFIIKLLFNIQSTLMYLPLPNREKGAECAIFT